MYLVPRFGRVEFRAQGGEGAAKVAYQREADPALVGSLGEALNRALAAAPEALMLAQQQWGERLKTTRLRVRHFQGVQQDTLFDDHGDSQRALAMTQVRNGRFTVVS